jgi:hypothetical protein
MIRKETRSQKNNEVDVDSASSGSGRSQMRSHFKCRPMTLNISSTMYGPSMGDFAGNGYDYKGT